VTPKIYFALLCYKAPHPHVVGCIAKGIRGLEHFDAFGCPDPETARNRVATEFFDSGDDVLVMCDHDIAWSDGTIEEIAARAHETGAVVGALCSKRFRGAGFAALAKEGQAALTIGQDGVESVHAIGTGLVAIPRVVLERVAAGVERVFVGEWEVLPVFDRIYVDENGRKRKLMEDYSFMHRVRELGIPILAATKPETIHYGDYGFTWRDAQKAAAPTPPRRFNVVVIRPEGYVGSNVFREMAILVRESLRDLGHVAEICENAFDSAAVNIVFGAHLLANAAELPPVPWVAYQLEQMADGAPQATDEYVAVLKRAAGVWNYSSEDQAWLEARGVASKLCPIGHHPALETCPPAAEQDIDVLFYGSKSERRAQVVEDLAASGVKVEARWCSVWGAERDALIARSKIVLNLHFHESTRVMEQVRISHLLNNGAFVLAEASASNPYGDAVATAPYPELAAACRMYLERPELRHEVAARGRAWLRSRPMTSYLREVI